MNGRQYVIRISHRYCSLYIHTYIWMDMKIIIFDGKLEQVDNIQLVESHIAIHYNNMSSAGLAKRERQRASLILNVAWNELTIPFKLIDFCCTSTDANIRLWDSSDISGSQKSMMLAKFKLPSNRVDSSRAELTWNEQLIEKRYDFWNDSKAALQKCALTDNTLEQKQISSWQQTKLQCFENNRATTTTTTTTTPNWFAWKLRSILNDLLDTFVNFYIAPAKLRSVAWSDRISMSFVSCLWLCAILLSNYDFHYNKLAWCKFCSSKQIAMNSNGILNQLRNY